MRQAFIRTLEREAETNPDICLLTADLGYKVVENFARMHPDRFYNAGVAEAGMVGIATGLALSGRIPFTYSIATFMSMRCYEQIRDDVCYERANVKIVGIGGGLHYGQAGLTHQALEDIAILRVLPEMTVICPADPVETELAVHAAVRHKGPVYLRLGKGGDPVVYRKAPDFRIGRGIVVKDGREGVIFATGSFVLRALEVSALLSAKGISVAVADIHTVKPLDTALVARLATVTRNVFTLEEHHTIGGLGSAVAEYLLEEGIAVRNFRRFGVPDEFHHYVGSQAHLHEKLGLSAPQLAVAVERILS